MDILITVFLCILCVAIGCLLGWHTEKKANHNPGKLDGYIAIDHDNGQFNLFAGFNQEPRNYLRDGQIVRMEVIDLTGQSQEKQRP